MPHAEMHDAGPRLNPHGREVVDEILAVHAIIRSGGRFNDQEAAVLTLAAYTRAGSGARLLHDPGDPMSRQG
jgi:hypothetical protein